LTASLLSSSARLASEATSSVQRKTLIETFCSQAARVLRGKLDCPVCAINSGCGSYNTIQELALVRKYAADLEVDLVLLVYVSNDSGRVGPQPFDPWSEVSYEGKSPPEVLRRLAWESWSYRLVTNVLRNAALDSPEGGLAQGPDWDASFEAVADMAKSCRATDIQFGVMLWRFQPDALTNAIHERLAKVCSATNTPLGDFAPAFSEFPEEDVRVSVVDGHPNTKGHRIAAHRIVEFLTESGLLPR